jgi:cell wall-associated NlpC family hydrolase
MRQPQRTGLRLMLHLDYSKYIGIPFVQKGRDWSGCDCWGLVILIYKEELGISLDSYDKEYQNCFTDKNIAKLVELEANKWTKVSKIEPLDVLLFKQKGRSSHVAIAINDYLMLHTLINVGSCIERWDTGQWRCCFETAYRYTR